MTSGTYAAISDGRCFCWVSGGRGKNLGFGCCISKRSKFRGWLAGVLVLSCSICSFSLCQSSFAVWPCSSCISCVSNAGARQEMRCRAWPSRHELGLGFGFSHAYRRLEVFVHHAGIWHFFRDQRLYGRRFLFIFCSVVVSPLFIFLTVSARGGQPGKQTPSSHEETTIHGRGFIGWTGVLAHGGNTVATDCNAQLTMAHMSPSRELLVVRTRTIATCDRLATPSLHVLKRLFAGGR